MEAHLNSTLAMNSIIYFPNFFSCSKNFKIAMNFSKSRFMELSTPQEAQEKQIFIF